MNQDISVSEHLLGKRIVNYLKNEALVGRINSKKLKVSLGELYRKNQNPQGKLQHYLYTGFIIKNKKTIKMSILL